MGCECFPFFFFLIFSNEIFTAPDQYWVYKCVYYIGTKQYRFLNNKNSRILRNNAQLLLSRKISVSCVRMTLFCVVVVVVVVAAVVAGKRPLLAIPLFPSRRRESDRSPYAIYS